MTAAIARLGDMSSGHGPFPPRPNIQASPNVFANMIPVHRESDQWAVHCGPKSCHPGVLAKGSSTVFANGLGVGRIADKINCGDVIASGSPNVFAG